MKQIDNGIAVGSIVGAVGAALAALLGTLCCAVPAAAAILGAGGALASARLEPYRPALLASSALMLAVGFWRAYAPGRQGSAPSTGRKRMVRLLLWGAGLVTLASAVMPSVL